MGTKVNCPVHSETKTIGLLLRPGETHAQRYAEWCAAKGWFCNCGEEARRKQAQDDDRAAKIAKLGGEQGP